MKEIAEKYFKENPKEKNDVIKAYYAFLAPHFRETELEVHNFTNGSRDAKCSWCHRTRENVRYDGLPGGCQKRPETKEIVNVIFDEEGKFQKLLKSAEQEIPKIIKKLGMSGETIAKLHHTYGYDLETVKTVVDVSSEIEDDYKKFSVLDFATQGRHCLLYNN